MHFPENGHEPLDAKLRPRLRLKRRGVSCLWFVLLMGCSESPGLGSEFADGVMPPDDTLVDSTGGVAAGSGGFGSGGTSQTPSSGGSGGSLIDPPAPSSEIQIEESTLGFCS